MTSTKRDGSFIGGDGLIKAVTGEEDATADPSKPVLYSNRSADFWGTLAGVIGNVLEWYDFAVFGYFGDVIGDVFFPDQTGNKGTMYSFLVFGGAFLMRPIGGVVMGYIGDRHGPKKALIISIFLMAFPTFAMGCLPSYEAVGVVAIVLLVLIRMLQGLSVGGQLMSSLCFTLETHDPAQWGLYGSYVMAAANFGTLLGALAGFVLEGVLTEDQLISWGWRVPFWSGIVVSFSGFYLRTHGGNPNHGHTPAPTNEEDVDKAAVARAGQSPLQQALQRSNLRPLLAAALVPMMWSAGFYIIFVWMAIYMKEMIDDPVPNAFAVNSMSLLISVCMFFPFAGMLSDRYGRVPIMVSGGLMMGLLSPFLIMIISLGQTLPAFASQCIMGVALSLWGAPLCAWLVESFEPQHRLTSVSIGYNVAQAAAGGSAPFLCTLLVDKVGPRSPGIFLTGLSALSLFGLLVVAPRKKTHQQKPTQIPDVSEDLEVTPQGELS